MKTIFLATVLCIATPAMAQMYQYRTTPNIIGNPGYGYTTQGPNGNMYQTTPNIIGNPGYGYTTTGPGVNCRTTPNILGNPGFGSTTTCN